MASSGRSRTFVLAPHWWASAPCIPPTPHRQRIATCGEPAAAGVRTSFMHAFHVPIPPIWSPPCHPNFCVAFARGVLLTALQSPSPTPLFAPSVHAPCAAPAATPVLLSAPALQYCCLSSLPVTLLSAARSPCKLADAASAGGAGAAAAPFPPCIVHQARLNASPHITRRGSQEQAVIEARAPHPMRCTAGALWCLTAALTLSSTHAGAAGADGHEAGAAHTPHRQCRRPPPPHRPLVLRRTFWPGPAAAAPFTPGQIWPKPHNMTVNTACG